MPNDEKLEIIFKAARRIVSETRTCVAVTRGKKRPNARVLQTSAISQDWVIQFLTHSESRKAKELLADPALTLLYHLPSTHEYVTLSGHAELTTEPAAKLAVWKPESLKWHPGGPSDPNVMSVNLAVDQIEVWSSAEGLVPDPSKGLWAVAAIKTENDRWIVRTTMADGS